MAFGVDGVPMMPFDAFRRRPLVESEHAPPSPSEALDLAKRPDMLDDLHIDERGILHGARAVYLPSKRGGRSVILGRGEPLAVVSHWTATDRGTGLAIARSWALEFEEHSAHVTIDVVPSAEARERECKRLRKAGFSAESLQIERLPSVGWVIYQSRTFRETSWHAGSPSAARIDGHKPNEVTIGVEQCCYGRVARRKDDQWRAWVAGKGLGYGAVVAPADVVEVNGWAYHRFASEIVDGRRHLFAELQRAYPSLSGPSVAIAPSLATSMQISVRDPRFSGWAHGAFHVSRMDLGHGMLDPTRKGDEPGPRDIRE